MRRYAALIAPLVAACPVAGFIALGVQIVYEFNYDKMRALEMMAPEIDFIAFVSWWPAALVSGWLCRDFAQEDRTPFIHAIVGPLLIALLCLDLYAYSSYQSLTVMIGGFGLFAHVGSVLHRLHAARKEAAEPA